ncbi:diguanylate cyclase domain-containing protein [Simplicispira lacusdiani]|uniref:diguanylate cyclase domain-containing protein n=1 Tax=Simplicispira lacusdiani TaxID=2213010 RepID=UPI000E72F09C|nr:diguanylate cyclase [Simplicispira lacusdiani]
MHQDRQRKIRELFDEYIEMYAARDDRLTARFSQNFTGYPGSGSRLIHDREEWVRITQQDFAQVPGRIRIEMLDLALQDLSDDVVATTAFFHIHLPSGGHQLSREVARLVLVFRREGEAWMIVHCSYSIPYQSAQDGEVYPLKSLQEQNSALQALVAERTQALHESQALYRLLTEDTQDVLWRTDSQLIVTYISPADERLRGFKADEVLGRPVFDLFNDEGVALVKDMIQRRAREEAAGMPVGFLTFQVQHRCKDGRLIWGEVMSKPDRNARGEIIGYHGITREITERKRLEEQVRQLAFYDPLTHLANRRLMLEHLEQAMSASKRSHRHGALLFLDLDNFKPLNDQHGHGVGDLLLIEVAERLKACVREADTVARFGGDEFVVLLCELGTQPGEASEQAAAIAEKIRIRLADPYVLQAAPSAPAIQHECTASIGVAVFHGRDESQNAVIDRADAAMYLAKEEGRNRIGFAPNSGGAD